MSSDLEKQREIIKLEAEIDQLLNERHDFNETHIPPYSEADELWYFCPLYAP